MTRPREPDTSLETNPHATLGEATTVATAAVGAAVAGGSELLDAIDFTRRYRDATRLGQGGMGEVRLCEDRLIGREVAVKVIHGAPELDGDTVQRFLREARVQARLEHPAVVPIHDVGRAPDGRVYFTMKRVRGETLAAIVAGLARGDAQVAARFSRRKLLGAFVSVCQAVELAHRHGVLHRDLKPANLMLGELGEVYVLDWGIARVEGEIETALTAAEGTGADGLVPTAAGAIVGTPGYMAPEQARGELGALDARTDVYALGAILFEVLALEPLHPRTGGAAALASTLAGVEARPARRAPARDVPPELDALVERAVALDPAQRPASVRALSDEHERYLDGDRDLELRRGLAERHAAQAAAMAEAALLADDEVGRSLAMQEVGRALALDPDSEVARRAMVRLMTTPPRTMPAEAQAQLDADALATQRFAAWMGVVSYLLWLAALPIGLWMGVASRGLFACFAGAQVLALIGCGALVRARRVGGAPTALATIAVWLATASLVLVFGALVLVPTVVAATMTWVLLHPRPQSRVVVSIAFGAIIVVPLALELLGVIAPSYRFAGSVMTLVPRMVGHAEVPTLLALLLGSMGTIVVLAVAITRMRKMLSDAEQRVQLHAWQLRQLVP